MKINKSVMYFSTLSLFILFIIFNNSFSIANAQNSKPKDLFINNCSKCHRIDGSGIKGVYPPLKNADYVRNNDVHELLRGMIYGRSGKIVVNSVTYNGVMTTEIDKSVTDEDAAAILNYVLKELNGINKVVTAKNVKEARKAGKLTDKK